MEGDKESKRPPITRRNSSSERKLSQPTQGTFPAFRSRRAAPRTCRVVSFLSPDCGASKWTQPNNDHHHEGQRGHFTRSPDGALGGMPPPSSTSLASPRRWP